MHVCCTFMYVSHVSKIYKYKLLLVILCALKHVWYKYLNVIVYSHYNLCQLTKTMYVQNGNFKRKKDLLTDYDFMVLI